MKKLLCKIGIHNWGKEGYTNSLITPLANKCKWCEGIRVFQLWGYTFHQKGTFKDMEFKNWAESEGWRKLAYSGDWSNGEIHRTENELKELHTQAGGV